MKKICSCCGDSFDTTRTKRRDICNECYCEALDERGYYEHVENDS